MKSEKDKIRKKMQQRLNAQKKTERRNNSKIIQKKLFKTREFLASRCIMLYISKGTKEVETGPIIKKAISIGKKVVLPVTLVRSSSIKPVYFQDIKERLVRGPYGIFEPEKAKAKNSVKKRDIDLVVVPGVAFDKKNNRLGHGRGYYDRFLSRLPKDTPKIGLGFRFQLLQKIPTVKTDIPLTKVITN